MDYDDFCAWALLQVLRARITDPVDIVWAQIFLVNITGRKVLDPLCKKNTGALAHTIDIKYTQFQFSPSTTAHTFI